MATANKLTEQKIKKVRSEKPVTRMLPQFVTKMAKERGLRAWQYLLALAEEDYSEHRKNLCQNSSPLPPRRSNEDSDGIGEPQRNGRGRGRKLNAEEIQILLHLHSQDKVGVPALAARFRVGRSTIRRAIALFDSCQHNHTIRLGPNRGVGRIVEQRRLRNAG